MASFPWLCIVLFFLGCESEPSAPTHIRAGDRCKRGVDTYCCIGDTRALLCSPGAAGTIGTWMVQHDAGGCPCACFDKPRMCPGWPDNYFRPEDAQ